MLAGEFEKKTDLKEHEDYNPDEDPLYLEPSSRRDYYSHSNYFCDPKSKKIFIFEDIKDRNKHFNITSQQQVVGSLPDFFKFH